MRTLEIIFRFDIIYAINLFSEIAMEESIYNLLPKEKTPPKKKTIKLYKSSIPGTLAPTGSTFGS